jgi:hypothetical protein
VLRIGLLGDVMLGRKVGDALLRGTDAPPSCGPPTCVRSPARSTW